MFESLSHGLFGYCDFDLDDTYTRLKASDAQVSARSNKREVGRLESRVDRLSLVCMAMWSLLQEKTGATEQDLLERVKELDLRDGKPDGKITRTVSNCPECGRVMSPRHDRCIYCGAERLSEGPFDAL